ncbi:hypothetical protein [Jiella avicenniae]|uniref:Uncharacterized protein n=1 Tax=Jiella avicenniae TaxID=2907202 RepID=A0A9X1P0R0_9HYPH|nr:hypothetical protein [Jiella avicenniae]MCE7027734.1 hypothetical protein [Jiella avicenniae]MCE7028776.1 hypothetical protein [Jiella avicenniae]
MPILRLAAAIVLAATPGVVHGEDGGSRPGASALPARADDLKAGLDVKLHLMKPDGTAVERPASGEAFRIGLDLTDAATRRPAGELHPAAWLRPIERSNLACNRAAETFNRTGRLPIGAIDLNGALVAVLHDDAHVSMVDPRLDLATSNIVSIADLGAVPTRFLADQAAMQVIADDGRRMRTVLTDGRTDPSGIGGEAARHLVATDLATWAGAGGTIRRISPAGDAMPIETGSTIARMRAAALPPDPEDGRPQPGEPDILAIGEDGTVSSIAVDGTTRRFPGGARVDDAVFAPKASGVLALRDREAVELRRADGGVSRPLALPAPATRLAIGSLERVAVAWMPGTGAMSFVEIASMMLAGAVSFERPIRELEVAGTTAYALLDDLSAVMVIDLAAVAPGEAPSVENVRLGPGAELPPDSGPYLLPLSHGGGVLALQRPTQTVFVVQAGQGEGMPPMTAFRIKGGMPRAMALFDRSLREVTLGRYETTVSAPAGGAWELVVTTGLAALSACFRIDVEGPTTASNQRTLTILAEPVRLGKDRTADLVIRLDFDETGGRLRDELPFTVMALDRPWQMPVVAVREARSNRYTARLTLPGPGQYPVMPGFALQAGDRIVPGLVRVENKGEDP